MLILTEVLVDPLLLIFICIVGIVGTSFIAFMVGKILGILEAYHKVSKYLNEEEKIQNKQKRD